MYGGGFLLWLVEKVANKRGWCDSVNPFQLHAWWHIGTGYGNVHTTPPITDTGDTLCCAVLCCAVRRY